MALAGVFLALSRRAEVVTLPETEKTFRWIAGLASERSRRVVRGLSALFALDAFGGGFVAQSYAAYWFHLRFASDPAVLGSIFFGANLLAGVSALLASRIAARFGLVRTMVWTHCHRTSC